MADKESGVLAFLDRPSSSGRDVSWQYFGELLARDARADRKFTATEWQNVVRFASEQCARWEARWLLSPAASPDTEALKEREGWEEVYSSSSEALVEQFPQFRDLLPRIKSLHALEPLLNQRVKAKEGMPVQRSVISLLSRLAILLNRVGLRQAGGRLYTVALFPKGTVGRRGEGGVLSAELRRLQEGIQRTKERKLEIIEKAVAEGKTMSTERFAERMEAVKASYGGPERERFVEAIDHFTEKLREKYGAQIPVDEFYRLQLDLERGRDPLGSGDEVAQDTDLRRAPIREIRYRPAQTKNVEGAFSEEEERRRYFFSFGESARLLPGRPCRHRLGDSRTPASRPR